MKIFWLNRPYYLNQVVVPNLKSKTTASLSRLMMSMRMRGPILKWNASLRRIDLITFIGHRQLLIPLTRLTYHQTDCFTNEILLQLTQIQRREAGDQHQELWQEEKDMPLVYLILHLQDRLQHNQ